MKFDNICSVFGHNELFDDENLLKAKLEREFLNLSVNHNVKKFYLADLVLLIFCVMRSSLS